MIATTSAVGGVLVVAQIILARLYYRQSRDIADMRERIAKLEGRTESKEE